MDSRMSVLDGSYEEQLETLDKFIKEVDTEETEQTLKSNIE